MSSWNLIYRLFPKIRSLDYFLSVLFCTISPKLFKGIKNAWHIYCTKSNERKDWFWLYIELHISHYLLLHFISFWKQNQLRWILSDEPCSVIPTMLFNGFCRSTHKCLQRKLISHLNWNGQSRLFTLQEFTILKFSVCALGCLGFFLIMCLFLSPVREERVK